MSLLLTTAVLLTSLAQDHETLRPPSVPLVVHDPYFSVWSPHDRLTDGWTTHWTGREQRLCGLVRVDGKAYRVIGPAPEDVPAMEQLGLVVWPTRTLYLFNTAEVWLELTFVTPALPADLDVFARPVTYVVWDFYSNDGKEHEVSVYLDASATLVVNEPTQQVVPAEISVPGLSVAGVASEEQQILERRGDDVRIDWGAAYLAQRGEAGPVLLGDPERMREAFVRESPVELLIPFPSPRPASEPALALTASLRVRPGPAELPTRHFAMLAYDDLFSIRYFHEDLRPYWRRNGAGAAELLAVAARDFDRLFWRCRAFDIELTDDLFRIGGKKWAVLCSLAYRQCVGANKLCADSSGRPLLFPKENFSNGCIATVDVIYPMSPLFLLLSSDLAKAMLVPVLDYARSPRWTFPFAPHDLGTYPHATGQAYGGGERSAKNQMPVEESANLILLVAATMQADWDGGFALEYWPQLLEWAQYLEAKGFDPENQLCTDDFTGHLAHNVNLSAKAILALGAFARIAEACGENETGRHYREVAQEYAARWVEGADDGEHTRLAFDRPGTWSQKYNLVWDRVLGLGLFPEEVKARELRHYRAVQNEYGLPLDSRATFTKIDWTHWSACLTGEREDFEALVRPMWKYVHETPDRVPICDWSDTITAKKINMIARPVIGGLFMGALGDEEVWAKWYARGERSGNRWAPLPLLVFEPLVPAADSAETPASWAYTLEAPPADWFAPGFDDSAWKRGPGGFGTAETPGAVVGTRWDGPELWLRRSFELSEVPEGDVRLWVHHDEDAEIYLNGVLAAELSGYVTAYEPAELSPEARATLRAGENTLAVHCRQTAGGQYIDAGLVVTNNALTK